MTVKTLENGASLICFADQSDRRFATAQNYIVEWIDGANSGASFESAVEAFVLFPTAAGRIAGPAGETVATEASVLITPPGRYLVFPEDMALILATDRPDLDLSRSLNAGQPRDERIAPVGAPFVRKSPLTAPEVRSIAAIEAPEGNRRIKFIQSATMSINLVLYAGPRGKKALSPHSHKDIEQGSLAVYGDYVHHLRTPWGPDGEQWLDDVHLEAPPHSLILIPPELVHTSEGVGPMDHFLIDIFAPPRRDFIGRGWVFNSDDYRDPAAT